MSNARTPSSRRGVAMTTLTASVLLACAELPPGRVPSPDSAQGVLITRGEIRASGARDAWEAIRKNVNHLRFRENADGDPVWVGASRGSLSLRDPDAPILLVVDGALMQSSGYLRQIPAQTVSYIQVLSGSQGTARYGIAAGNGVVIVRTQSPARGVHYRRRGRRLVGHRPAIEAGVRAPGDAPGTRVHPVYLPLRAVRGP